MSPAALRPDHVRQTVVEILLRHSTSGLARDDVADECPLIGGGFDLDSIALLGSILDIERDLGVRLREEDLTEEALGQLKGFVDHICRRLSAAHCP